VRLRDLTAARRGSLHPERGQALVEFVLVLFPLVVLVGGVIQFGIGVANWHDLNRIANEGARYAALNSWPGCPATATTCTDDTVACSASNATANGRSLINYLRCEVEDAGLPASVTIVVCTPPPASAGVGEPVTVKLSSRVNFLSIFDDDGDHVGENKVEWLGVDLRGEATMRVDAPPTKYTAAAC
jgi:TadE-like protein